MIRKKNNRAFDSNNKLLEYNYMILFISKNKIN